jgi:hypothetical protein
MPVTIPSDYAEAKLELVAATEALAKAVEKVQRDAAFAKFQLAHRRFLIVANEPSGVM